MAHSAAESQKGYAAELLRLLEPRPGRVDFAIRLALICALTGLVAEIYQTPDAALTMYAAFFLNKSDRANSLILSAAMLLLFTIIIASIFVVARAVIDDAMWRFISMAVISFGMLFLASASKLKPIAGIVAMIVGYALDRLGMFPVGEVATRALLYVWLFVGIPAGVSMAVNLVYAVPPRRLAERTIAWRLRLAASMLRSPDARIRARFTEALREGTAPIEGWLRLAGVEKTASPKDIAALRQAAASTLALSSAIDMTDRYPAATLPLALRDRVAQTLDEMAGILAVGGYPIEISWEGPDPRPELTPLSAKVFADIKDALIRFTDIPNEQIPTAAARESGFLAKDAFTNPDHVRYALKTTAAAMFCYVLYTWLDWPGIHTCFITCYLVSLDTAAESVEKLALRILGCLIGAAAGFGAILLVLPALTSIGALMIVVFLGALVAAYVAGGTPRISYAGFQIAFAFFLCVVQGSAPAFDVIVARDRVVGILLGNLVVYLVQTQFWPVSVARRIDPAIAGVLRRLSTMARSADSAARRTLASEAQAALGAVETNLQLARYEPEGVRPPQNWLLPRETAAREIGALEEPLLLGMDEDAATRLEHLAAGFEAHEASGAAELKTSVRRDPLQQIVDDHLQRLERVLARADRRQLKVKHYAPA